MLCLDGRKEKEERNTDNIVFILFSWRESRGKFTFRNKFKFSFLPFSLEFKLLNFLPSHVFFLLFQTGLKSMT